MNKPLLSSRGIFNMNFGFLGIQFGFGLQQANMSAIYAKLGALPSEIPILWLAAPMTGLLVQPLVGAMSDRTWNWLGRRRPYFFVGAILSSLALFFLPNASALWIAATMLWILDTSINVSMEPFRAFVADLLPQSQRTFGYVMQSFFIGIGAAIANGFPSILAYFGVEGTAANGIPLTVLYSFKLGALGLLIAVLWTVVSTRERPPADLPEFRRRAQSRPRVPLNLRATLAGAALGAFIGLISGFLAQSESLVGRTCMGVIAGAAIGAILGSRDVSHALSHMPRTMKKLVAVQFFTWMGLFCMWLFFTLATAQQVFGTLDPHSSAFDKGIALGGQTFAWYSIVCFCVAFALPPLARLTSRRTVHSVALILGGACLLATGYIHDRTLWQCTMVGVGVAWASVLVMPYAILSGVVPAERMGVYMGVFNFSIVVPEIVASVSLEPLMKWVFGGNPVHIVMLGGALLLIAALLTQFVGEEEDTTVPPGLSDAGAERADRDSPPLSTA